MRFDFTKVKFILSACCKQAVEGLSLYSVRTELDWHKLIMLSVGWIEPDVPRRGFGSYAPLNCAGNDRLNDIENDLSAHMSIPA